MARRRIAVTGTADGRIRVFYLGDGRCTCHASPMRRFAIACAIVLGLAYVIGIPLFLRNDDSSLPNRADAVVALSGSAQTLPEAQKLVREGLAPVLVVSDERTRASKEREALCRSHPKQIICVNADPFTTSSEPRVIAQLANNRSWTTLVVVAPDYESLRVERAFGRCPGLTVVVQDVDESWWRTAIGVPLEWVKLGVSETVRRDC